MQVGVWGVAQIQRIEVESESALEHGRILRDDCKLLAEGVNCDIVDARAANNHAATAGLNQSKQRHNKRALAAACAPHNPDF